jgi:3D (Asp-Asp-Asp) domain-containing protein
VKLAVPLALALAVSSCAGVQRWPDEDLRSRPGASIDESWRGQDGVASAPENPLLAESAPSTRATIELASTGDADGLFRNTYYDFPKESSRDGGPRDATLYDAACAPITKVTRAFHDQVCVQGSGRLSTGLTVSFAKRDCACADVCPRTGQKICFERLDPARFPYGRGATGGPITPLVTVAVDVSVIPLGTPIYVPEFAGLSRADGSPHDGCFIAQDRGLKVVGKHIDVFTGDPAMTAAWNARVPSNRGVHVRIGDPRCRRR